MAHEVLTKPDVEVPHEPLPHRAGPLAVVRFWVRHRMITPKYGLLVVRLLCRRFLTPAGWRMSLAGMLFLGIRAPADVTKAHSVWPNALIGICSSVSIARSACAARIRPCRPM